MDNMLIMIALGLLGIGIVIGLIKKAFKLVLFLVLLGIAIKLFL